MKRMFYLFLVLTLFLPSMVWAEAEMLVSLKDSKTTYDKVWDAVVTALYELRLPISFMNKESGYMVTEKKEIVVNSEWNSLSASRVRVTLRLLRTDGVVGIKIFSEKEHVYWNPPSRRIESSGSIEPAPRSIYSSRRIEFSSRIENDNSTPFYFWEPIGSDAALENEVRLKIISLI